MVIIDCHSDNDDYHPDVTPIVLAAQRNNFTMIKVNKNRQAQTSESLATNSVKFHGNKWFKIKTFDARTQHWALHNLCAVGAMWSVLINWFEHFVFTRKILFLPE